MRSQKAVEGSGVSSLSVLAHESKIQQKQSETCGGGGKKERLREYERGTILFLSQRLSSRAELLILKLKNLPPPPSPPPLPLALHVRRVSPSHGRKKISL